MNPRLDALHEYPFQRLAVLKQGTEPGCADDHVAWSIGEPQHPPPDIVLESLTDTRTLAADLSVYPATRGTRALREAISNWVHGRFGCVLDPERQVLPVNGTREALFSFAQAVIDPATQPVVALPNPFYQIYEGAALLAGAQPHYIPTTPETGYLPDFDAVPAAVWDRCQLLYICSPGNPTGRVLDVEALETVLSLAERHDFVVAADECYSEIYAEEPPPGLLQAAARMGNTEYRNCMVFHSLSKRSNLPGLRSGFVAGHADLVERYYLYRTYQGGAMGEHVQRASVAAWSDERHVLDNRLEYRRKFDAVIPRLTPGLDLYRPDAGFYLWARIPGDDTEFALALYRDLNVTVLPGSYLGRATGPGGTNPGSGHIRIALVAPLEDCVAAAERVAGWLCHAPL